MRCEKRAGGLMQARVKAYGLDTNMVEFLQRVYADNETVVTREGVTTKPAKIKRGLRQGCPLSPLLFMIYISQMEKRLDQSNIGVDLGYMQGGQTINQRLAGLMYADDIVLLADPQDRLQELIKICREEGQKMGLQFSRQKSRVIIYNDEKGDPMEMQDTWIDHVQRYKYLGIFSVYF